MKDWKYIAYVFGALAVFVIVKAMAPKQYDWRVTLAHDDKNPYGAYALYSLIPHHLNDSEIKPGNRTLYELKDSLKQRDNLFVLATTFSADEEDTKVLLDHVSKGGNAFISAQYFWGFFSDTLHIGTHDYSFTDRQNFNAKDTSYLKMVAATFDSTELYAFRRDNIPNYFDFYDTLRTTVIARNDLQQPVTLRLRWGKGNIILNSTPLAFTNIYLLHENKTNFAANTFSYLPAEKIWWMEYYHLGRRESESPLRFILTNEPLQWAYYIALVSIVLFMLFEAKRKQRIIPVIKPLANTTLEFVSTIGNLYYQNGDHKNMAEKRIVFLLEQIRTRYGLRTNEINTAFLHALANKSGKSYESIEALFKTIRYIKSSTMISPGQLLELNRRIELFECKEKEKIDKR